MQTLQTNNIRTESKLYDMLTENTGIHGMDSGGANGRHWQRNRLYTLDDFLAMPEAVWERSWSVTLNVMHYLTPRIEFDKSSEVLTRLFKVWELADYDNRNPWSTIDQHEFLEHIGATVKGEGFNTYNFENNLSQVLQGFEFELNGNDYVLLQIHGGADVRGGYSRPAVFLLRSEYWLHDSDSYSLECLNCLQWWSVNGCDVWECESGSLLDTNLMEGCSQCGGDLVAHLSEVID